MNTKRLSVLLAVVMLLSVVSVFASAEDSTGEALAWTTGDGYGAVVENKDGTATFTGDETLNSDNSHCGSYTKDGATAIADGDITDELDVMIDPISMEAGEKFGAHGFDQRRCGCIQSRAACPFLRYGQRFCQYFHRYGA